MSPQQETYTPGQPNQQRSNSLHTSNTQDPQINGSDIESLFTNDYIEPIDTLQHWGDKIEPKNDRTMRLYFQNINGLPTNDNDAEWNHILSHWKNLNIDIE